MQPEQLFGMALGQSPPIAGKVFINNLCKGFRIMGWDY